MIEETVIQYLTSQLDVPVYAEVPKKPLMRMVIVEKTGSSKTNHIKSATIAIQSYAETMYDASILNEQVKEAMDDIIELDEVTSSRLQGDYNYTDTSTKHYRYQAVYALTHY